MVGGQSDPQPGRRDAGRQTTEGMITMDLRFATFHLIYRDVVLRPLLVNYADHLERCHAPEGVPASSCFVRLRWSVDGSAAIPAGHELLAAEVHMPRHSGGDDPYLHLVLQRLRTALGSPAAAGSITTRCVQTSPLVEEGPFGSIVTTSTFEVAPPPPQRCSTTIRTLAPWTGWAEINSTDCIAPRGGTPGLN
jgi:hypothetical protein